jgi:hypothetical protein
MTGIGSVMFVPYREVADRRRVKGDGDFDLPSGFLARKGLKPDIATERATRLSVSLVGVKVGRRGEGSPRFLSIRPLRRRPGTPRGCSRESDSHISHRADGDSSNGLGHLMRKWKWKIRSWKIEMK